ncbi:unnamed protein product, partial [Diamesa serratosioi]
MSYNGRPPPRIDGMISLKVDNLTYRTTPEDLRRVFERCGEVGDIYIPRDRHTRESRGFAFVRFYDKRDAEDALDAMDGRILDGRELRVQMARYGRPTSPQRRSDRVLVQGTVVDVVSVVSHALEVEVTVASHDHILVQNRSLVHAVTANHPVVKNPTVDHLKFVVLALTAVI